MLIDAIEVHHVRMPLLSPWRTAAGNESFIDSVLVAIHGAGRVQWGESSPWGTPLFSAEWASAAVELIASSLAPLLVGKDIASGDALVDVLKPFKGNYFAKAAIDNAFWALHSEVTGRSLPELLGGTRAAIRLGADFEVMDSVDELIERVGRAVDSGAPRVKLKFRPGWDLSMLGAVRATFPDVPLHIDCNAAYSLEDLEMFRKIDGFGLTMIEQPLHHDDLLDHATLQGAIGTPICLDESIVCTRVPPPPWEPAASSTSSRAAWVGLRTLGASTTLLWTRASSVGWAACSRAASAPTHRWCSQRCRTSSTPPTFSPRAAFMHVTLVPPCCRSVSRPVNGLLRRQKEPAVRCTRIPIS